MSENFENGLLLLRDDDLGDVRWNDMFLLLAVVVTMIGYSRRC